MRRSFILNILEMRLDRIVFSDIFGDWECLTNWGISLRKFKTGGKICYVAAPYHIWKQISSGERVIQTRRFNM